MTAVKKITPHLHTMTCPDDIRKLPAWLTWRYEHVPGEEKPRKVPYYASGKRRSGVQGSPEDVAQLVTYDAAVSSAARRGHDGVGIATLPEWNVTVTDFDRAIVNGELSPEVERAIAGTYAEFSPSGEGVHAVTRGSFPNKKNHGDKRDPKQYGVETFHSKGFVTWTGNTLPITQMCGAENTIAPMSEELLGILTSRLLDGRNPGEKPERPKQAIEPMGLHHDQITECLEAIDPEQGHDQWLRIGMAIHHETNGEGFDLWDEWSEKGATYPGREALQRRWDSFGRKPGGVTIRSLLKVAHQHGVNVGVIGVEDDFEDLSIGEEDKDENPGPDLSASDRFQVIPAGEFIRRPRPGYIVKGFIPWADLGVIYGASGDGKSFVMIDICMAIARGVPWRGLKVKQGRVVYICAEGAGGFRNRLEAYATHNGISLAGIPFGVIQATPNLLDPAQVKALCASILKEGAAVIVVDTFAQTTPGANENSAEDMGKAISNIRAVGRAVKAVVILVHHAGKDASKGARGWSGIKAAADFEIEITRDGDNRAINTTKQKDADDGRSWPFRLETVPIGMDDDGDVVESCVIVESDVQVEAGVRGGGRGAASKVKFGPWEQAVLDTYAELAVGGDVLKSELVMTTADKMTAPESLKIRRATALRAVKKLCDRGPKKRFAMVEEFVIEEAN
jgi:hypothetical protein